MNTKPYTDKLPSPIRSAMKNFVKNECVLVKQKLDTANNQALNCHYNVKKQVEEHGGKVVNGWLLNKESRLVSNGVWYWTFHSLWQANDKQIYDITIDKHNAREFSTFWYDNNRTIDLTDGISYNDIVIFDSKQPIDAFTGMCDVDVTDSKVYWTLTTMSRIRDTAEYDGQYRFLRPEFPNNYEFLREKYSVEVVNGKLKSTTGQQNVHPNFLFEFNVSARR